MSRAFSADAGALLAQEDCTKLLEADGRSYRRQLEAEDAARLEQILRDVGELEEPTGSVGATAAGDERRLREDPGRARRLFEHRTRYRPAPGTAREESGGR